MHSHAVPLRTLFKLLSHEVQVFDEMQVKQV